jgi:hypothetical protein
LKPQAAKDHGRRGEGAARSGARSGHEPEIPSAEPEELNCDWIPSLAEPYLRGYTPQKERGKSLSGYRFLAQPSAPAASGKKARQTGWESPSAGFFIGYLLKDGNLSFLKPVPPEFLVFCFIEPVGGGLHRRLVSEPESLMRKTVEYIRWLTHHPPRFELFADERAALIRHLPTQEWPAARIEHYARNFTIETLAWLVRSALIRRLPEELAASSQTRPGSQPRANSR